MLQYDIAAFEKSFRIFVAESLNDSLYMIQKIRRFLLVIIPVGILLVSFMAIWIAGRSLDPIKLFSGRIRTITHK